MKREALDLTPVCEKCGKEQKPNKEQSTQNWIAYDNVPCECGGRFKPRAFLENKK